MRAVWSFWSLPHLASRNFSWRSELHHRLSWVLSVETARPHFASTALYTDQAGAHLLVNQLGLVFDHVDTSLESLASEDPDWWVLGKLHTYAQQSQPFVHIDSDAYLFQPLPPAILAAPVFAQSPEPIEHALPWYDVEGAEMAIRSRGDGAIPPAWSWYRTFSAVQQAACCGILGGQDADFLARYATTALALLCSPRNRHAFDLWTDKRVLNPLFEQFVLSACAAYEQLEIAYLFDSHAQAASGAAARQGFTHLMAFAKSDADFAQRLQRRVARDFPAAYAQCVATMIHDEELISIH